MSSTGKTSLHDTGPWPAGSDTRDRDTFRVFAGIVTGSLLGSAFWLTLLMLALTA